MIWAIDNDDFRPECSSVRYPLLRAINAEFKAASSGGTIPDKDSDKTTEVPSTPSQDSKGPTAGASGIGGFYVHILLCVLSSVIFVFSVSK